MVSVVQLSKVQIEGCPIPPKSLFETKHVVLKLSLINVHLEEKQPFSTILCFGISPHLRETFDINKSIPNKSHSCPNCFFFENHII